MSYNHSKALFMVILLTAVGLFGPNAYASNTICRFVDIYSSYSENGQEYYQQGSGSVFRWKVDSRKYIITAAHVIAGAARIQAKCDGQMIELKPLGRIDKHDLAVLVPSTQLEMLEPLFDLPQENIDDFESRFKNIALANTFFYDYKTPEAFKPVIQYYNEYPFAKTDLGIIYIRTGVRDWRANDSNRKYWELSVNPEWRPLWELEKMWFMSFGIQPGMSGSAVIQLKHRDILKNGNQNFIGIVSRSKYLSSYSAFVSADTVNADLDILMGRTREKDSDFVQKYEFRKGELRLSLDIHESGDHWKLDDVCSSSSDFVMTSRIEKKKELGRSGGSDWGEGGGGEFSKRNHYFMDKLLGTTAMIPQETCEAKGVKANEKYIYLFRGHPINAIDDLISVKRKFSNLSYSQILNEAAAKQTYHDAWCSSENPHTVLSMSDCNFIRPLEKIAEIESRRTSIFPRERFPLCEESENPDFKVTCSGSNQAELRFSNTDEQYQIERISLKLEGKNKVYSIKIGTCEETGTIAIGNPLTTLIRTRFGKISINRVSIKKWKIQLNDIALCGLRKSIPSPQIFEIYNQAPNEK